MQEIGLRQEDIFRTVTDKIVADLSAKSTHDASDFGKLHLKLIENVLHLGLHDTGIF